MTTPDTPIKPHSNEEGQKYWHLFKHVDVDDPVMSPLLSKKLVTEVFFPRILYAMVNLCEVCAVLLLFCSLVVESATEVCG